MIRAIRIRLYPTPDQKKYLAGLFGAVRFCYNKALYLKTHFYKVKGVNLHPIHDLKKLIAIAKKSKKYAWLAEYDCMALQESLRNLNKAYGRFFKKEAGYPRFKSRRGEQSSYHCTGVSAGDDFVKVPKMKKIKAVMHRKIEGKVKSITLSMDACGDYWASVLYEDGLPEAVPATCVRQTKTVGVDVGIETFGTCSDGEKIKGSSKKSLAAFFSPLQTTQPAYEFSTKSLDIQTMPRLFLVRSCYSKGGWRDLERAGRAVSTPACGSASTSLAGRCCSRTS